MASSTQLKQNSLGLASLVFFVVAAASPLTGLIGAMPVAILEGNGGGISGIYVLSGLVLLLFSVGFITMSRHIKNSGAFYAYISAGLGSKLGVSGLALAILAYVSIQIAIAAIFGLFTQIFFVEYFQLDLPWWLYTIAMLVVVCWLGIERIEIGGKVLGVLMLLEVGIAVIIAAIIVYQQAQLGPLDFQPFAPKVVFDGNVGIALVFAVAAFIGFEATAIYTEECRNPEKTIPLATIIAVLLITSFFAFCSWGLIQAHGAAGVQAAVAQDPELFVFQLAERALGKWSVLVINILLITSLFAATQSFHNNIARYFYVISRDGLFWSRLAKLHPTKGTPYLSSLYQTLTMVLLTVVLALAGQDPLTDIFTWGSAITTMAVLLLQMFVSIAVVAYFNKRPELGAPSWKVKYAPILSALTMSVVLYLVVMNLETMSGLKSKLIYLVPVLVFGSAISGYAYAWVLAKLRPDSVQRLEEMVDKA
ncbi:APC family permease [Neisseriaceae bacterium CLB008]